MVLKYLIFLCLDVKVLNSWDPMTDEYNDVLNSYGVNFDDIQVATDGYSKYLLFRSANFLCVQ